MWLKDFIFKKAVNRSIKKMPEEQQKIVGSVLEKDPDLFQKIDAEINAKKKQGQNEEMARIVVMKKYQKEIQQQMIKNNTKYKLK